MNAQLTNKGRELALSLAPSIGAHPSYTGICSLICRSAATYCRIQEAYCSVEMSERETKRVEKQEANIEKRIRTLCAELPLVSGEHIKPSFQGDPRGATIKLKMPDGRYDDWGQEGICVPGS